MSTWTLQTKEKRKTLTIVAKDILVAANFPEEIISDIFYKRKAVAKLLGKKITKEIEEKYIVVKVELSDKIIGHTSY